jgi:hypothetical protein
MIVCLDTNIPYLVRRLLGSDVAGDDGDVGAGRPNRGDA